MKKNFVTSILVFLLFAPLSYANNLQLGAGLGIPYGGIGINTKYHLREHINLSLGVGVVSKLWTVGGVQYYPNDEGLRLSAYYGSSLAYDYNDNCRRIPPYNLRECDTKEAVATGLTAGIGWDGARKQSGWDIDALIRLSVSDDYKDRTGNTAPTFTFSFGYHWAPF